ncbi:hemagglutinin, partial [Burkholderia cenocepacia]|nr:hemagglutinin [Burkholderia cenocepacia]
GTPNYKTATLAGEGGTTLTNVKAGALSATSTDAVNGSQLFATNESLGNLKDALKDGGVVDETTGESLAVVYDGTSKDKVTLAGKTGTTLSNVKAGTADLDAVNVSQLKASGLIGVDGKSIAAVTYDKKADGTPNYGS